MPLRSFKGCKRYNKEKGNGEKQCYGGAVFLHVYKLFIRDAEREKRIVEVMTGHKIAGMALVLVGLLFVNAKGKGLGEEKTKPIYIVLVLISCLCNAVSELLDKMLMQSMNSGQLQFWYMFFMVILYLGYMIVTKTKIDFRTIYKNYWILILSVLFVIGDKALFIACSKQESTVVAMTLIKQCSVMITIIGGRIVFKEKRTLYKMVCAAVIIAGIVFAVM